MLDWKMRIDESDNLVFRGFRSTIERIQFAFSLLFLIVFLDL